MRSGCAICQDLFDTAIGIVTTKCGHVFHNICIEQWLARSSTCPECRRNVCKSSLTKLFFNTSFDTTVCNDSSLDIIKEEMRAKDFEILERDKKIEELKIFCTRSEKDVEKMHQNQMKLESQLSTMKRELRLLSQTEVKSQKLLQENNILQNELEHLNNVKTIVEGCCNDTKKILADVELQVMSEKGKEAIHRIATYCSVIKRELTCSMEEKNQLQNELTRVKRQMGLLQATLNKKIKQLEQQVKRVEDLNSSSFQSPSVGPVSVLKSGLSQSSSSQCNNDSENQVTPISFNFQENKKKKLQLVVLDREIEKIPTQMHHTPVLKLSNATLPSRSKDEDSVLRVGYNGLGGHRRIVTSSGIKRPLKKN